MSVCTSQSGIGGQSRRSVQCVGPASNSGRMVVPSLAPGSAEVFCEDRLGPSLSNGTVRAESSMVGTLMLLGTFGFSSLQANGGWNIVWSWGKSWDEILGHGSEFITGMGTGQTIDRKTLNCGSSGPKTLPECGQTITTASAVDATSEVGNG